MELFAVSGLVNALSAVAFGFLVFSKNWRSRQGQVFFLMTAVLAVWGFSYWRWLTATDAADALLWVRLLAVGSVFIPVFFLDWVVVLLGKKEGTGIFVTLAYLASITVALSANSPYLIAGVEPKLGFLFWPNAGILYTVYFWTLYVGVVCYTIHALYHAHRDERDPHRRGQLLYILIGAALGFGGGFTNFLLWFDIPIPPYGNFLVAAFPFLLGFSVIRHGLFNLKTIATEILVFFIGLILFIELALSHSLIEVVLRALFFLVVCLFGVLLIRSVYREVEQRERIEKLASELEKANERLKELDQLKSEFVSLATHQIRGPITAIKGYASMLLEGDYGMVPEICKGPVETILQSSSSLAGIVQDFLDVSRIEQGRMKYDFSVFDVGKLASDVANELAPNIAKKGLELRREIEAGILAHADLGKLRQVIENLIDNAQKYTAHGAVTVGVRRLGNGRVEIVVRDTGVGITQETIAKLFQKFSRAEDASKANILGTGLGLYVAKQLITAQGGTIRAESLGAGKGSSFIVELPIK